MTKYFAENKAKAIKGGSKTSEPQPGEPEDATRRQAIRAVVLGGVTVAASSGLGAGTVFAKERDPGSAKKELSGKTAFITGGARGIGLATAEEMAKAGANIVLYDIASGQIPHVEYPVSTESDLQYAKSKIEALGVQCLAVQGDVRSRGGQESAMAQAVTTFGRLDIVVANAGVTQAGNLEEFSDQEIGVIFDINVGGVLKTTQAASPFMKKQQSGRIIYISSGLGRMGNELFPIYASSKWAVIGFAKSAALALAPYNIMCNVICPGLVHTKLFDNEYILKKMAPHNPTVETVWEMLKSGNPIPIGYYEPIDIARAVMIFAGDATAKVTGEVFDISCGTNARGIG